MMEHLPYAYPQTPSARNNRLAKWVRISPLWLLGMLLLLPVLVLRFVSFGETFGGRIDQLSYHVVPTLSFAVLFMPGALRRLNWRHLLVMLGLAVLWSGLDTAKQWSFHLPFPYAFAFWDAMPIVVVGLGEWSLAKDRTLKSLVWLLILSLAAGCVVPLITQPLNFTGATVSIPGLVGWSRKSPLGDIIYWPLLVSLTWVVIPAGLKLNRQGRRSERHTAAALALTSVAAFGLFFNALIYPLARQSLRGGGPFSSSYAASILETRGSQADRQAIREALEKADWSKPEIYDSWDYRRVYIEILARQDPQSAARLLSEMLSARPSDVLASFGARLLAGQHRYEAVPLLMRYALLGNSECIEALETMMVPEVALAIIRNSSAYDRPAPLTADFPISSRNRERLTRLLGKDAGPNMSDWTTYYDSMAGQLPTPLPEAAASETNRVVQAMVSYGSAMSRLYEAKCRLLVRRLEASGNGKLVELMTAKVSLLTGQRRLTEADAVDIDPASLSIIESHQQKASADMAVSQPDWTVNGTSGLERDVQSFAARVDTMISNYDVATTAPTTRPTPATTSSSAGHP